MRPPFVIISHSFTLLYSYLNWAVVLVNLNAELAARGEVVWLGDVALCTTAATLHLPACHMHWQQQLGIRADIKEYFDNLRGKCNMSSS